MTDPVVSPKEISRSRLTQSAIAIAATAMVLIGLVLLYLLTQATNNRDLYEQTYSQLFTINVVVAALLLAGIVWVGVQHCFWRELCGSACACTYAYSKGVLAAASWSKSLLFLHSSESLLAF